MPNTLSQTFPYAGWSIKYEILDNSPSAESKKTVVFVHGTPWSSVVFRPLAEALSAIYKYRVLLYDLAGYGKSQSLDPATTTTKAGFPGDTSVKFQAELLAALLAHLSQSDCTPAVIAHDIAGAIALRAHLIHGVDFESLMLWDTNAVLPWGDGFYKLCRSNPQIFTQLPPPIFEAVVRAVTKSACAKAMPEYWEEAIVRPWLQGEDDQTNFVRQIAQADDGDVREMLEQNLYDKVRCKVRILCGEADGWIPREKMEELAGLLGDTLDGFVTVPDASHLLMVDQPERVMGEVVSWLEARK